MILDGRDGPVELSPATLDVLRSKYPATDVAGELAKAHRWLLRNPARRPVRMMRFVETWLARAPRKVMPKTVTAWWTSEKGTLAQGAELGMQPRPGEDLSAYRQRIADKMRAA